MEGFLKAVGNFFVDFIETAVVALSLFVVVYLFIFQPHQVKGDSMLPNYHDGEYLLTNKVSYRVGKPKRGDVIIFKAPKNEDYDYIKRIIALPQETVWVNNGQVFINDVLLDESLYLANDVKTKPGLFLSTDKRFTLPDEEYFVMGDNRDHSSDSRDWGSVPTKNIIGKAWFRYWPPQKMGFVPSYKYSLD